MNEINELLKQFGITEDEKNNFVVERVSNVLIEWMKFNNEELLNSMFNASKLEDVKMYQGMYKQNERIISLIEVLKGVEYVNVNE